MQNSHSLIIAFNLLIAPIYLNSKLGCLRETRKLSKLCETMLLIRTFVMILSRYLRASFGDLQFDERKLFLVSHDVRYYVGFKEIYVGRVAPGSETDGMAVPYPLLIDNRDRRDGSRVVTLRDRLFGKQR